MVFRVQAKLRYRFKFEFVKYFKKQFIFVVAVDVRMCSEVKIQTIEVHFIIVVEDKVPLNVLQGLYLFIF